MNHVHKKRLLKLAEFLEKLPRRKFGFGSVVFGREKPRKELDCGSTACAMGWCPIVFPSLVKYKNVSGGGASSTYQYIYDVDMRQMGIEGYIDVAMELFGLDRNEATWLFHPGGQFGSGLPVLNHTATPRQVAGNIRTFVKRQTA